MTRFKTLSLALVPALTIAGCAGHAPRIPDPLSLPGQARTESAVGAVQAPEPTRSPQTRISDTPKPPAPERLSTVKEPAAATPSAQGPAINFAFEQIPLPSFILAVYGQMLKRNVDIDPKVQERKDLVTIRTGEPQTPAQVAEMARLLLKSYGIAVVDAGSLVRVVPDSAGLGYLPEIRRGRALPETPIAMRPVFQLVELQAVRQTDVMSWLRTMFGQRIQIQEDPMRNAVLLGGNPEEVLAAIEAIQVLDQPLMKGRQSARINPGFWSSDELAKKLAELLTAEGYSAGTTTNLNNPITLIPVPAINAIIAFSSDPKILEHVLRWAEELDKPAVNRAAGGGYFTYQVRNTDAAQLAETLQELMSGPAAAQAPAAEGKQPAAAAASRRPSRVVVNAATNTLIFQGNSEEYTQLLNLLQDLDRPPRSVLIEVTVAELDLSDTRRLGIEWGFTGSGPGDTSVVGGTIGGVPLGGNRVSGVLGIPSGAAGFSAALLNSASDVRLVLNALASSDRSSILSNPHVFARSGEVATIQVGDDVPILTQQQTSPVTGGTGSIIQNVQYRNTGVVLQVKPIVHGRDRVDLDVMQEVSELKATSTGNISSPTIATRKVETKLSLKDGATVVLGGLIKDNRIRGDAGVPVLKDLPVLGNLFRTDTDTSRKTEMLVLITPYIVSDDEDARAITDAFRHKLGGWAAPKPPESEAAPQPQRQD